MSTKKHLIIVTGLICLMMPALALGQDPQTDMGGPLAQWGKALNYWNGMMFGPRSFDRATTPNPDATPNSITISAYQPSLTDTDMIEIGLAKTRESWGKRGDVGLYFPMGVPGAGDGKMHFILGKGAETFIRQGGMLRGFATVGMPVDDYGAATWGKNVATVNVMHGINQAKKSRVFRQALAAIAKKNPELKEAAQKFDIGKPELSQALAEHAKSNPALAKAMATFVREMSTPMAFVINSGFTNNEDGSMHYAVHKRRANEAGRPTRDKVVSQKVADLMYDWWMKVLPQAKTLKPKLFDINHCAGVYDAADWTYMLKEKLQRKAPKLVKEVMRRTYSYDLGAGASRPEGVRHRVQIGARDMFGQLNTPTSVLAKAKLVKANHMTNETLGKLDPSGQTALEVKPFAEVFGLRLYDGPAKKITRTQRAKKRSKTLSAWATCYQGQARFQADVLKDLQTNSPPEDKTWTTYKVAEANLRGNQTILKAKQNRAQLLSRLASLKASGGSAREISATWAKIKQARRSQKAAERQLNQEVTRLGRGRSFWTDVRQYQRYIHGDQPAAKMRHLEKRGPAAVQAFKQRAKAHSEAFRSQIVNVYGRAKGSLMAVRKGLSKPTPARAGAEGGQ